MVYTRTGWKEGKREGLKEGFWGCIPTFQTPSSLPLAKDPGNLLQQQPQDISRILNDIIIVHYYS